MNRPSREELAAALVAVDERAPDGMDASILADEVRALRAENPDMTTHAIADAITREVIASMREENARLREEQKHWHDQLVSAQSECRELREDIDNLRTIAMERKATIERVEELVPAWRAESKLLRRNHDDDVSLCIADLEAALKGGE